MENKNNKRSKASLNEVVDINGSKVFVENGEVKVVYSEAIEQSGYMSVEESRRITHEVIKNISIAMNYVIRKRVEHKIKKKWYQTRVG